MSRAAMARAAVAVSLVALLGGAVAGQSTTKKPAKKRPPASAAAPAAPSPAPATDVRVRTRYTSGVQISENTTYLKGARQRIEFPGAVSIEQCDLGRTLLINPTAKTYLVTERSAPAAAAASTSSPAAGETDQVGTAAQGVAPPTKGGGVVTILTTLTDTGERKQMFGREARHVTTTMTKEGSSSACDKEPVTVEVDGWYVDLPGTASCPIAQAPPPASGTCADRVESKTSGDGKLGFPLSTKTTTRSGAGGKQTTSVSSMEVTAFELTTLDAALFEAPAGFSQAPGSAQMMAGFEAGGGFSDALLGSTADGTSTAAPKTPGSVRIGVLEPIDKSSRQLPTRALRQELAGEFGKPPFEAVAVGGTSVAEAQADAARMQCDYVLSTEIAEIKTSKPGRMGSMLKKVSRDGPPRDTQEVTLDYRLYPVGAAAPAVSDRATASSGGGFNVRSAVHVAMFAGSMYMRFSGLGLLNPMLSNFGGGLGSLSASGLFDPRMSAMSSLAQLFATSGTGRAAAVGTSGNEDDVTRQTVDSALASEAKAAIEHLRKNQKQ